MKFLSVLPRITLVASGFAFLLSPGAVLAEVLASADSSQFAPEMPSPPDAGRPALEDALPGEDEFGDIERIDDPTTGDYFREGFETFVEQRDDLSRRLFRLGLGMDRYLAGGSELDEPNQTYARLRLAETWLEGEGLVDDSDLKFHLDLPASKRRYRLILENDTEDTDTALRERSNPGGLSEANLDRESISAAVRLAVRDLDNWHSDFDVGVRGSLPLDPFVRHNLKRSWALEHDWNFRMRQRAGYFNSKGYTYNLAWGFDSMLEPDLAARVNTEVEWEQSEDKLFFGQAFGFTRQLNDRQLLDHVFGIVGQSLHVGYVDQYYFAVTHRSLLYKDWLILDLVPEVSFPRERDFRDTFAFTVRLEVLFFEHNPFKR